MFEKIKTNYNAPSIKITPTEKKQRLHSKPFKTISIRIVSLPCKSATVELLHCCTVPGRAGVSLHCSSEVQDVGAGPKIIFPQGDDATIRFILAYQHYKLQQVLQTDCIINKLDLVTA